MIDETLLEGKVPVAIGDATFYVKLPERLVGSLSLLAQESFTASERYKLAELLRGLKCRTDVVAVDPLGAVLEGEAARQSFFSALKERESALADWLRKQLQKEVEN